MKVKGKDQVIGVYECIDGEDETNQDLKRKQAELFQQGIDHFQKGDFIDASTIFAKIYKENPKDLTAKKMLLRSNRYIQSGIPSDWDGVESMQTK